MKTISELNSLYEKYPKISLVKNKFEIIKRFKKIEKDVISSTFYNFDKIIFNQLNYTISFNNYRYIYILSNLRISDTLQIDLLDFIFKFLNKFAYSNYYYPHIHYLLKILSNLPSNEIENNVLILKSKPIFDIYMKEFIILLGNVGSKNSIQFLMTILKKSYLYREFCFLSIGKIASYRKYPTIKRSYLKEYLNFSYKLIHKNPSILSSIFFCYSLCEIFLIANRIDGKMQNKFSELLFSLENKNRYTIILYKIINNLELSFSEKIFLEKIYYSNY